MLQTLSSGSSSQQDCGLPIRVPWMMQTCACSQNNSHRKEKLSAIFFIQKLTLFGVCICVCVCVVTSCPILCDLMDLSPPIGLLCWWRSPGKNTGMGCQAFFQGISLTQGLNLNLLSSALAVWFFTTRATWGWKPNSLLLSVYFITLWCLHRGPLAPGFRLLYSERLFW